MAVEILLPKLGVEMETAVLTEWMCEEGSEVAADQVVLTVETEKVSFEITAAGAGLLHHVAEVGEEYEVGALLAYVAEGPEELAELSSGPALPVSAASSHPSAEEEPGGASASSNGDGGPVVAVVGGDRDAVASARRGEPLASPLARRVAAERGLSLAEVSASGPGGKILRRDVESAIATLADRRDEAGALPSAPAGAPTPVPLSATRRTIARRMLASLQETAQMTDVREYEVSALVELRKSLAARSEALGYKLSFTDLFVRATAIALREVPALNATFSDGELLQYPDANIGVAVAMPDGLVVPVLHAAGAASIRQMHARMETLIGRARERKISAEEISGGTFTVTNIGSYGSQLGTPVLNPPQVGILGTGAMQQKPVVRDGEIVVGTTMHLSLTVDHRVIDGEVAGRFLNVFEELFAEPRLILLG